MGNRYGIPIVWLLLSACGGETNATGGVAGTTTSSAPTGGGATGGSTSTSSGGGGGGAADGGSTGGTAGTTGGSTSTAGGTGGACVPAANPCGEASCGTVDDGCGTQVTCGMCGAGQVCKADGQCCTPKTCADYPKACKNAVEDDGCGSTIQCGDAICGDGLWMSCKSGACGCLAAVNWPPGEDAAQQLCDAFLGTDSVAYYCGADTTEAPDNCYFAGAQVLAAENQPWLWCCL